MSKICMGGFDDSQDRAKSCPGDGCPGCVACCRRVESITVDREKSTRDNIVATVTLVEERSIRGHGAPNRAEWWESPEHVKDTEALLVRSGILSEPPNDDDGPEYQPYAYFRSMPWSWDRERAIARVLERTFEMAGIPVEDAWEMTGQELMAAMQKRDAKRGLR